MSVTEYFMICDKHECIFVHIPKTAGRSVETFFLNRRGLSWEERAPLLLRPNTDPEKGPERLAHLMASEYVKYGYIDEGSFRDYYKFSFVRNPWERLVSEFHYRNYSEWMSFSDYVSTKLPEPNLHEDGYRHIIPQSDYLYDGNGELLVDFVGKFESLQEDFDKVCKALGLDESQLPYIDMSRKRPQRKGAWHRLKLLMGMKQKPRSRNYADYYDRKTREVVSKMYEKDIDLFKYTFG